MLITGFETWSLFLLGFYSLIRIKSARHSRLNKIAVFSRALFQVANRVTTRNLVKTVAFLTRLKLSESENFNAI